MGAFQVPLALSVIQILAIALGTQRDKMKSGSSPRQVDCQRC
jgi:hypothetical protein